MVPYSLYSALFFTKSILFYLTSIELGKSAKNKTSMGIPITASCDTAWNRTRVSSDASSTEMQCLIMLRHSGAQKYGAI
jgi:hypothetical protein